MILIVNLEKMTNAMTKQHANKQYPFKRNHTKHHYKSNENQHRVGELLVHYGLRKMYQLNSIDWQFKFGTYGKPYIDSPQPVFISLSYSGNYVACAFDQSEIGLDIENLVPIEWQRLKIQFTKEEAHWIDNETQFYMIWTQKEAYAKLTGKGLSEGVATNNVLEPLYYHGQPVAFQTQIKDTLMIQLCQTKPCTQTPMVEVDLETLLASSYMDHPSNFGH